jgi:hypothetical protein
VASVTSGKKVPFVLLESAFSESKGENKCRKTKTASNQLEPKVADNSYCSGFACTYTMYKVKLFFATGCEDP